MSLYARHRDKRQGSKPVLTNTQAALLFATLASSLALAVNWSGTSDVVVAGICGGSAVLLLLVTLISGGGSR